MRILFTGLPYFSQQLVDDLNEWDSENKYVFLNTYYSKIDQIKFLIYLFRTDLVVSFNGAYSRSRALDAAIFFKKKIFLFKSS